MNIDRHKVNYMAYSNSIDCPAGKWYDSMAWKGFGLALCVLTLGLVLAFAAHM